MFLVIDWTGRQFEFETRMQAGIGLSKSLCTMTRDENSISALYPICRHVVAGNQAIYLNLKRWFPGIVAQDLNFKGLALFSGLTFRICSLPISEYGRVSISINLSSPNIPQGHHPGLGSIHSRTCILHLDTQSIESCRACDCASI